MDQAIIHLFMESKFLYYFSSQERTTDYHRPSDDADKINFDAVKLKVVNYVYDVTSAIVATNETKPDYVNVPRKESGKCWRMESLCWNYSRLFFKC
ncbi:MAG: hypothetical protein MZV64_25425 [Ignavibacteriales bacterium]|nr:hypothetical protein [Ignavibacteriales bacterium]